MLRSSTARRLRGGCPTKSICIAVAIGGEIHESERPRWKSGSHSQMHLAGGTPLSVTAPWTSPIPYRVAFDAPADGSVCVEKSNCPLPEEQLPRTPFAAAEGVAPEEHVIGGVGVSITLTPSSHVCTASDPRRVLRRSSVERSMSFRSCSLWFASLTQKECTWNTVFEICCSDYYEYIRRDLFVLQDCNRFSNVVR